MAGLIRAILSNFTVTSLLLGCAVALLAIVRLPRPRTGVTVAEPLLRWYLFFAIGVGMLYNFVLHVFFGASTARFIGWADSPFQTEVGLASLGFAVVGFMAFRGEAPVRLAAIVGPACFLVGAGVGHLRDIAATGNLAPGSAGSVLYTDFLAPVVGLTLWWLRYRGAGTSR